MNKILIVVVTLVGLSASLAFAADKQIKVDFSYEGNASEFRLYMDGTKICTTPDGQARSMDCPTVPIPYGVHIFTLTAIDGGIETSHSSPYSWVYMPEQGDGPLFINFSVTVDGKEIKLGPATD